MHLAVLDDNIADRNQMNRLLTRASDENKRNGREGYYIDLYGNFSTLFSKLAMYDGIFIDMTQSEKKGHEIAEHIHDNGIFAKLILCISDIDYEEIISNDYSENFIFMKKPIKPENLRDVLELCESHRTTKEPLIEIRTKDETLYVKHSEFLYAKALVPGKTTIVLSGRDDTIFYKDISLVKGAITEYPFMIAINKDTIVSTYHIRKVNSFSVVMDDDTTFSISLKMSSLLRKIIH